MPSLPRSRTLKSKEYVTQSEIGWANLNADKSKKIFRPWKRSIVGSFLFASSEFLLYTNAYAGILKPEQRKVAIDKWYIKMSKMDFGYPKKWRNKDIKSSSNQKLVRSRHFYFVKNWLNKVAEQ